jgi:hypothetical protein
LIKIDENNKYIKIEYNEDFNGVVYTVNKHKKIERVEEYIKLNEKNKIIKKINVKDSDYYLYKYKNNNLTSIEKYSKDKKLEEHIKLLYDNGNIIEFEVFDDKNKIIKSWNINHQ